MKFAFRVIGSFWAQMAILAAVSLTAVLVARAAGPAGAGAYTLAVQYGLLAVIAGSLGVDLGIVYRTGSGGRLEPELAGSILLVGLAWGCLVAAVGLLAAFGLSGSLLRGVGSTLLLAAAASVPFGIAARYLRGFLLGGQRILAYNASLLAVAVPNLLLAALALVVGAGVPGATAAFAVAAVLGLAACLVTVPIRIELRVLGGHLAKIAELVRFGLQAQASNVLQFVSYRLDLALVNALVGLTAAGQYAVASLVAEAVCYLPNSVALVLVPRVAALDSRSAESITPLICRATLALSLVSAGVIALAAPALLTLVFGRGFEAAVVPLWVLLPGTVALSLDKAIAAFQLGQGRPRISLYVTAIATPVTLAAYVALIPTLGLVGAAIASTISYVWTTTVELYFLQRVSSLRWPDVILPQPEDARLVRAALRRVSHRLGLAAA